MILEGICDILAKIISSVIIWQQDIKIIDATKHSKMWKFSRNFAQIDYYHYIIQLQSSHFSQPT